MKSPQPKRKARAGERKGKSRRQRTGRRQVAESTPARGTTAIVKSEQHPLVSVLPNITATVGNLELVRRFISRCMNVQLQHKLAKLKDSEELPQGERERLEIDWGTIPGVDKPFLKQPGAEKFLFWLSLRPEFIKRETSLPDGHLEIVCSVTMYSKKTSEKVFEGPDCSCTTMESNYRFRWAERESMPTDKEAEALKAKGLGKFKKKWKWAHGKKVKEEWVWFDRIENPNIQDERNKVRQIGQKRALVKCVRNMGALSEIFTSDPSEWAFAEVDEGSPYDDQDFTPEGREIFTAEGKSPSGKRMSDETIKAEQREAQRKIVEQKTSVGAEPRRADTGLHPSGDIRPAEDAQLAGKLSAEMPTAPKPLAGKGKTVIVTWPSDSSEVAHIGGDITELVPTLREFEGASWLDVSRTWAVVVTEMPKFAEIARKLGYEVKASGPQTQRPEKAAGQQAPSASRASAAVEPAGPQRGKETAAGPAVSIVSGTIEKVTQSITHQGRAQRHVKIGKVWYACYHEDSLFQFLDDKATLGKDSELYIDSRKTIVGIKRIGKREFTEGRFPVIDVNEERTGKLF